jgi:hypothetical protein
MRQASVSELCISVLCAGLLADGQRNDVAVHDAIQIFDRIRAEVDTGGCEDRDLEHRRFSLHASLLASALSAGRDIVDAMKIADDAVNAVFSREEIVR